jgi:hypothetical protein
MNKERLSFSISSSANSHPQINWTWLIFARYSIAIAAPMASPAT